MLCITILGHYSFFEAITYSHSLFSGMKQASEFLLSESEADGLPTHDSIRGVDRLITVEARGALHLPRRP